MDVQSFDWYHFWRHLVWSFVKVASLLAIALSTTLSQVKNRLLYFKLHTLFPTFYASILGKRYIFVKVESKNDCL